MSRDVAFEAAFVLANVVDVCSNETLLQLWVTIDHAQLCHAIMHTLNFSQKSNNKKLIQEMLLVTRRLLESF